MTVYFLQPGTRRVVKIGYAAEALPRLKTAQTYNPDALRILATMPGDRAAERRLHARFEADQIRGEWFRLSASVREFLLAMPEGLLQEIADEATALSHQATKVITPDMLEKGTRDYLVSLAKIYSRTSGLALGTISRGAHGSASFLRRYQAGSCSITLSKYDEMLGWFQVRWPAGVPFPELTVIWDAPRLPRSAKKISAKA